MTQTQDERWAARDVMPDCKPRPDSHVTALRSPAENVTLRGGFPRTHTGCRDNANTPKQQTQNPERHLHKPRYNPLPPQNNIILAGGKSDTDVNVILSSYCNANFVLHQISVRLIVLHPNHFHSRYGDDSLNCRSIIRKCFCHSACLREIPLEMTSRIRSERGRVIYMSHLFSPTLLTITKTQRDIIAFVFAAASHDSSYPRFLQIPAILPGLPGGEAGISGSVSIITSAHLRSTC